MKVVHIRMEVELKDKLKKLAKKERRTMGNYITILLAKAVRNKKNGNTTNSEYC